MAEEAAVPETDENQSGSIDEGGDKTATDSTPPSSYPSNQATGQHDPSNLSTGHYDLSNLTAESMASNSRLSGGQVGEGDGGSCVKKLQKADSGIDVEKSPSVSMRDGLSDGDGGDSISDCWVDSTGLSQSESFKSDDSPCQSEDYAGVDASFTDNNIDLANISSTELTAAHRGQTEEDLNMKVAEADSPSDLLEGEETLQDNEEGEETSSDAENTLVRRKRHIASDRSTDGDEEGDKEGDEQSGEKQEEEEEEEDVNNNPWPKHKWRALYDLRAREIGATSCTPPSLFREKVQGSLRMVQRLKLQYRMMHHEGCVNSLHFNRIGTLLASGADDLQVVLWNWARNRKALVYDSGHRSNVFQAKFMPYSGDCHLVTCARDGQVRLSELSLTGVCKNTKKLAQHKGAAHKLALEYDSPHVFLSCGEDALTFQFDLREEKPKKLVVTKENDTKIPLYSIHSNPMNSNEFLTSGRDPYVRVYDKRKINEDVNSGIVKKFCPRHLDNSSLKTNVTCACYSYNGTEIVGSYNDEDIYVFDNVRSDSTDAAHHYSGHRNNATVKGVSFYGPRSEYVVTGSDCGHIFLWDKETEHVVQFLDADHCGVVNVLEAHPFAPVLATSGLDHDVKIWAPIAHDQSMMEGLEMTKRKNRRDRRMENENSQEPEMIDGQMLWFIMNHFRRSARRRLREGGEDVSSSSNSSDSDDDDDDEEDHEGAVERMQCQTS